MFLLDTEVVTEIGKAKAGQSDARVAAWASGLARQNLVISALTLLELENGAARLERRDRPAGQALRAWIGGQVLKAFENQILPVDVAIVRRRGQLAYADARDGLLAATALEHGLTLVTRNLSAFKVGKVKLFNPWTFAPDSQEDDGDWGEASRAGPLWLRNLFVRT